VDVAKSTDGGRSFSSRVVAVHGDLVSADPDKPYLAVDAQPGSPYRGTIYVSYTDFVAGIQIRTVVSRDGGSTWSKSLPISRLGSPAAGDFIQYSLPVVAPDGTVYIFWMESDGIFGHLRIEYTRSRNGGKSWSQPADVASNLPSPGGFSLRIAKSDDTAQRIPLLSNSFPAAAIALDGTIYVAWTDFAEGSCDPTTAFSPLCENADLRLSLSRDGGKHWTSPVKVNDDATRSDQFMPWIATHPDGLLSLAWLDRRLDPDNVNYDVFYSNTVDGVTFLPNLRVSTASSLVGTSTQQGLGDYNGLAATADAVFPIWGDMRVQNDMEVLTATGRLGP
ncbi:MAG TPA: sialidase family protein, partial [Candidatus Polarisedimenticolia bacterium]|nr:sialidase family protein [Candidatus Polarisedimenticolia bacterium]